MTAPKPARVSYPVNYTVPVVRVALVRDADAPSRILDLTIHDHVIVGNGTEQFVSLDERGLI